MNKIILGLVGVLAIGLIAYNLGGDEEKAMVMEEAGDTMMQKEEGAMMESEGAMMEAKDDSMMKADDVMMGGEGDAMMAKVGIYEDYSPEKLASNENIVLFFKASWCPSCKAVDSDIVSHLESIPNDLTILKVDYDNSAELKKKYGVTSQHTFVQVDKDGNLIKKWLGSPTLAKLVAEVK